MIQHFIFDNFLCFCIGTVMSRDTLAPPAFYFAPLVRVPLARRLVASAERIGVPVIDTSGRPLEEQLFQARQELAQMRDAVSDLRARRDGLRQSHDAVLANWQQAHSLNAQLQDTLVRQEEELFATKTSLQEAQLVSEMYRALVQSHAEDQSLGTLEAAATAALREGYGVTRLRDGAQASCLICMESHVGLVACPTCRQGSCVSCWREWSARSGNNGRCPQCAQLYN